jgi:hypothetical protein
MEAPMPLTTILVAVLVLALLLTLPRNSYAANWGYGPSGLIGVLLVVLIVLIVTGHLG